MGKVVKVIMDVGGCVIGIILYFLVVREFVFKDVMIFIEMCMMIECKEKMFYFVDVFIVLFGGFGIFEEFL